MTPKEKLKEIEVRYLDDDYPYSYPCVDIKWLSSRIKVLEEALEFCSVINMPMKAVKGEDFAQYALEEHCRVARKALERTEK